MFDRSIIKANLTNTLTETSLSAPFQKIHTGKVRDTYLYDDKRILITTDRQSAFDRILAAIPFKGQVLNQVSAFWFKKTQDIIQNHIIAIPDPNVSVVKSCKTLPVEIIVRGYITGVTDTAAWYNYEKGEREFCGNVLPEGLKKNQKFKTPIITPTTKPETGHDEKISRAEIIRRGLVSEKIWNQVEEVALNLFARGTEISAKNGLILVDTKYEMALDENGELILIDEIHTPDSSRYWLADTYEEKFIQGLEPDNFDKEFLRLWFKKHCDPYADETLPDAPPELVEELAFRYIEIAEKLIGQNFEPGDVRNINARIDVNLKNYFGIKNS